MKRPARSKHERAPSAEAPPARLAVRVQPRASKEGVMGWRGPTLCLRLTAPPVEGAANAACEALLAELLGLRRSEIRLVSGERSREKLFEVSGLTFAEIQEKIRERQPEQE
jgi:uncharacterized protein (TIGR00251 family)